MSSTRHMPAGTSAPRRTPNADGQIPVLAWEHSSIAVDSIDAACNFLQSAFGFQIVFREDGMSDQIASITGVAGMVCDLVQMQHPTHQHILELIAFSAPGNCSTAASAPIRTGGAHVAFQVPDLDQADSRMAELGAQRIGNITSFGDGPAAYFRAPGGIYVELQEPGQR